MFGICPRCRQETLEPSKLLRFEEDERSWLRLVLECTTCGRAQVGTAPLSHSA